MLIQLSPDRAAKIILFNNKFPSNSLLLQKVNKVLDIKI